MSIVVTIWHRLNKIEFWEEDLIPRPRLHEFCRFTKHFISFMHAHQTTPTNDNYRNLLQNQTV